jgi:spermidine synthase
MIARLRAIRPSHAVLALGALGLVVLAWSRLRRGPRVGWAAGAITLSVGSTGFVTMALSIVWLFAFQSLYGYVYQRIGWIIALFMAGLVVGCLLGGRRGSVAADRGVENPWRWLIAVDVLLALLALAVPLVLPALSALQDSPARFTLVEWCISLLVVATGVLGGAAFPLAGQIQLRFTGHAGATAGAVVSADHAGACLGALLCGLVLVPVLGTATAAFLLAGMKVGSAAVLIVNQRFVRAA